MEQDEQKIFLKTFVGGRDRQMIAKAMPSEGESKAHSPRPSSGARETEWNYTGERGKH